jgi:hypothetical protein
LKKITFYYQVICFFILFISIGTHALSTSTNTEVQKLEFTDSQNQLLKAIKLLEQITLSEQLIPNTLSTINQQLEAILLHLKTEQTCAEINFKAQESVHVFVTLLTQILRIDEVFKKYIKEKQNNSELNLIENFKHFLNQYDTIITTIISIGSKHHEIFTKDFNVICSSAYSQLTIRDSIIQQFDKILENQIQETLQEVARWYRNPYIIIGLVMPITIIISYLLYQRYLAPQPDPVILAFNIAKALIMIMKQIPELNLGQLDMSQIDLEKIALIAIKKIPIR